MITHRCGFVVALALLAPAPALAQSVSKAGTVAAPFLEIPVGATAIGMGGAFVSLATDASALYWNSAGAAFQDKTQLLASHMEWIADTRFDYAALVVPLGDFGTLGVTFTALGMGDMKVRTVEQPEGTGEYFSASDIAAGVSYARRLSDRFTVGFTVKYIQQTIWHETATAFALDLGTMFRTDLLGGLVIGAALSNFGTDMQLEGRDMRTFVRVDPTKLGSNDQIPYTLDVQSWDLPLLFQLGVSFAPVRVEDYRWTVAVDAIHQSDNYESLNLGTEFAFQEFLFVRAGYHSLFLESSEESENSEGGLTAGLGLASSALFSASTVFQVDYAYRDMGRLNAVHTVSLSVRF